MRRIVLLLIWIVFNICMNVNAQIVILKRSSLSERLALINSKVTNKNFETAIDLFYNTDSVILVDNVNKKELEKYNELKRIIDYKKTEFQKMDSLLFVGIQCYNSLYFNKAIDLLDLKLTEENSYFKTQRKLSEIQPKIKALKNNCDSNKINVVNWCQLFNNEEYEKILDVVNLKNSYSTSFYTEDLESVEELQKKIEPIHEQYDSVKDLIISQSTKCLNVLNTLKLNYKNSELGIVELESILQKNSTDLIKVKGHHPILSNDIYKINEKIKLKIKELNAYRTANKPHTNSEIKRILFEDAINNAGTVHKYATPCNSKIIDIYDTDVFKYYDLKKQYDTPLKQEIYKKTDDYKTKYIVLDSIKNGVFYKKINPMYVDEGLNKTKWEYDIEKKGFNLVFNHSSNGRPPKNIFIAGNYDNNFLEFHIYLKTIPTYPLRKTSSFNTNMWEEYLFIPINETDGLELENEKENLQIYFIFNLENIEKVKFQWVNTGILPFENVTSTESVVCSNIVRVLLINELTYKIYFDKIYR